MYEEYTKNTLSALSKALRKSQNQKTFVYNEKDV
jgi:hypothetical protein